MDRHAIPFDRIRAAARLALAVQMLFSPLLRIPKASRERGRSIPCIPRMCCWMLAANSLGLPVFGQVAVASFVISSARDWTHAVALPYRSVRSGSG